MVDLCVSHLWDSSTSLCAPQCLLRSLSVRDGPCSSSVAQLESAGASPRITQSS